MHTITLYQARYNPNHYSRPYIARCTWNPATRNLALSWGTSAPARRGQPTLLTITAPTGAVVLHGQTAYDPLLPSKRAYYTVHADGQLCPVSYDQAIVIAQGETTNDTHAPTPPRMAHRLPRITPTHSPGAAVLVQPPSEPTGHRHSSYTRPHTRL